MQEITNESRRMLNAAYTDEQACFDKSVLGIISTSKYDTHFILAVLCSESISWIFPRVSNKIISSFVTGSFPRIMVGDARNLPIPAIEFAEDSDRREEIYSDIMDAYSRALETGEATRVLYELKGGVRGGSGDAVHDAVSSFAEKLGDWYDEKLKLNTDLLSYIEPFESEGTLEEVAQPVSGVEDTVLTETGYEPQYIVEDFELEERFDSVDLWVKVGEEDGNSDDMKKVRAFRFLDLSDTDVRLLKEYLPVALEKSREKTYAGFLPYTTSRHSLMERLRGLEIPELSDIESSFEQYVEVADRQEFLEERIDVTEFLIDEGVYSLYGLHARDREIIEEGLQEQED
jgi:hypothetical protein